jgi:hypothetical protein
LKAVDTNAKNVSIFKTLWVKGPDGRWMINGMKGLDLKPREGFNPAFFPFQSQMELLTEHPRGSVHDIFSSFGPTDFLLKQSIVPVVAFAEGDTTIRCIGTASIISCSGYVMTACHVLLDPADRNYGDVVRTGNTLTFGKDLQMGVLIPVSAAYNAGSFLRFFSFETCWYWGEWKESPLFHQPDQFQYLTDIAICKISEMPDGTAHQPLNLSLNPFRVGETAYALGYALMDDIPFRVKDGRVILQPFTHDLYVSVGDVMTLFPQNHVEPVVSTPGPCFDFKAKIPGKMSGGPIFGADGAVVRGVVSRSFSGESHGYGAMLGPIMHLALGERGTLKDLMDSGNEGIARFKGRGI